jgi:hypothetical protein
MKDIEMYNHNKYLSHDINTVTVECFRNHTKGGFIGGFLFRINVKKAKPFAQWT